MTLPYEGLRYISIAMHSGHWVQQNVHDVLAIEGFELVPFYELVAAIQFKSYEEYPDGWQALVGGTSWVSLWTLKYDSPLALECFIVRKPVSKVTAAPVASTTKEDEHTRMMAFFFQCKPSDPDKLPPPPKQLGLTSWSIWDED